MATEAGAGTLVLDASAVVRLLTEVANALWKLQRSGSLVDQFEPDRELQVEALALACHLDHPVYDCLYLALARREAARILTADQRLQRLANQVLP
jgi:predicted nucleic acid-binding protein